MVDSQKDELNAGGSVQRSFRLSRRTMRLLDDRARELSESRNSLAERLLDEGLHTERHPLIVFRTGGSGRRRPALIGTRLYVWQIVDTVRENGNSVPEAADYLGASSAFNSVLSAIGALQQSAERKAFKWMIVRKLVR